MDKNGQLVDETSEMMEENAQLVGGFCSTIKDLAPIYPEIHQFRAPPPPTFGRWPAGQKNKTPLRPIPSKKGLGPTRRALLMRGTGRIDKTRTARPIAINPQGHPLNRLLGL